MDTALSPKRVYYTTVTTSLNIGDTLTIVDTALSPKHVHYTTTNSLSEGHSDYSGHCSQSSTCLLYTTTKSLVIKDRRSIKDKPPGTKVSVTKIV